MFGCNWELAEDRDTIKDKITKHMHVHVNKLFLRETEMIEWVPLQWAFNTHDCIYLYIERNFQIAIKCAGQIVICNE